MFLHVGTIVKFALRFTITTKYIKVPQILAVIDDKVDRLFSFYFSVQ